MSTSVDVTPGTSPPSTDGPAEASVTSLVAGIITDAQTLIRQQAEMFKAELRQAFHISKYIVILYIFIIICTIISLIALITALAYLLHEQLQFTMWASWGLVGGAFLLAGVASAGASYVYLKRFMKVSNQTVDAIQETLEWKTK